MRPSDPLDDAQQFMDAPTRFDRPRHGQSMVSLDEPGSAPLGRREIEKFGADPTVPVIFGEQARQHWLETREPRSRRLDFLRS